MTLEGKVALVTGAASGIGEAAARTLTDMGATVWLADINAEAAKDAATRLGGQSVHLDVTDEDSWTEAVSTVTARSGPVSVLVNNAGIFTPGGLEVIGEAEFRRTFDVNSFGPVIVGKSFYPFMKKGGSLTGVRPICV